MTRIYYSDAAAQYNLFLSFALCTQKPMLTSAVIIMWNCTAICMFIELSLVQVRTLTPIPFRDFFSFPLSLAHSLCADIFSEETAEATDEYYILRDLYEMWRCAVSRESSVVHTNLWQIFDGWSQHTLCVSGDVFGTFATNSARWHVEYSNICYRRYYGIYICIFTYSHILHRSTSLREHAENVN